MSGATSTNGGVRGTSSSVNPASRRGMQSPYCVARPSLKALRRPSRCRTRSGRSHPQHARHGPPGLLEVVEQNAYARTSKRVALGYRLSSCFGVSHTLRAKPAITCNTIYVKGRARGAIGLGASSCCRLSATKVRGPQCLPVASTTHKLSNFNIARHRSNLSFLFTAQTLPIC